MDHDDESARLQVEEIDRTCKPQESASKRRTQKKARATCMIRPGEGPDGRHISATLGLCNARRVKHPQDLPHRLVAGDPPQMLDSVGDTDTEELQRKSGCCNNGLFIK